MKSSVVVLNGQVAQIGGDGGIKIADYARVKYVRGLGSRNIVSMIKNWKDF